MNTDTLIVVCGYSGDAGQVRDFMPLYRHHRQPVLVLSPEDAPITAELLGNPEGVICRWEGKKAYIGELSGERQRRHLRMMLDGPYKYFLVNDADSFCLEPKISSYLYESPDVFWSNEVSDECHVRLVYVLPRIAMQPPYFFSRAVLEKLVKVAPTVQMNPQTPYIDHFMLQLVYAAGIKHRSFVDGVSRPTTEPHRDWRDAISIGIRAGRHIFIHSVKTLEVANRFIEDYKAFKR